MRVVIVWEPSIRLIDSSIRYERYARGLRSLGHEVCVVCTSAAAEGFPEPVTTVADRSSLLDPLLWKGLAADVVLIPTWLQMADLLASIRPHVKSIIALADTDGYLGVRVHPRACLRRMLSSHNSTGDRVRSGFWWLRQYLRGHRREDAPTLASARLTDRIVVYSPVARDNLRDFFQYWQEPTLAERVIVAPYPVDERFESEPVATERDDIVVAIGRWAEPQKRADLLASSISRYLHGVGRSRFVLFGSNGHDPFRQLLASHPGRVEYRGVASQAEVFDTLSRARVLLSTSAWESGPIVASEALLRGCTLVGPASIPGFRHLCEPAGCGMTFLDGSADSAAKALSTETLAWESGRRDPEQVASHWRGHFTPQAICRQLLQ